MENEEIIAFINGLEYRLKMFQEDLDRMREELEREK